MLKENERVVRENNQLHQQLIEVKEQSEIHVRDMALQVRQLQSEKQDLQFMAQQSQAKMEQEISSLKGAKDGFNNTVN